MGKMYLDLKGRQLSEIQKVPIYYLIAIIIEFWEMASQNAMKNISIFLLTLTTF